MDRLTGSSGFTITVTVFDRAGDPVAQVALLVRWQVTRSLFAGLKEKLEGYLGYVCEKLGGSGAGVVLQKEAGRLNLLAALG